MFSATNDRIVVVRCYLAAVFIIYYLFYFYFFRILASTYERKQ